MTATWRTSKVPGPQSERRLNGFEASAGPPPEVVAFSESPSSSAFEYVYRAPKVSPLLNRRSTSTCSALYELFPSENHDHVFASAGLARTVVGTKYDPA